MRTNSKFTKQQNVVINALNSETDRLGSVFKAADTIGADVRMTYVTPTVLNIQKTYKKSKIKKIVIDLDWNRKNESKQGLIGKHEVYKQHGKYVWTDNDNPYMPKRSFNSIDALVWEYELPKSLIPVFKQL
tara:strand:- start:86 stop:478 length:393 start_codon:yes stop_codon:yes gene_type:complete